METASPESNGLNEFVKLYSEFQQYPGRASLAEAAHLNPRLLRHYNTDILSPHADKLTTSLFADENDQKVAFREVNDDGEIIKYNCFSDDDLRLFLCLGTPVDKEGHKHDLVTKDILVKRPDPRCRFVFLLNDDRGKPLRISQRCAMRLLSFHQVSPGFLDVLAPYRGTWSDESELHFNSFRTSTVLDEPLNGTVVPSLGRSGCRYQMAFDIKVPTALEDQTRNFYKIRQVALHHQFDIETGVQLWIVGDPHGLVKERIQKYLPKKGSTATFGDTRTSFRSSLGIQLEILGRVIEEWSSYAKNLHVGISRKTDIVLWEHGRARNDKATQIVPAYKLPRVTEMQKIADEASKALVAMPSNRRIMGLLETFYEQTLKAAKLDDETRRHCEESFRRFKLELGEMGSQHQMHVDRVRESKRILEGRIKILAQRQQRRSNNALASQASRSGKEAITMRIITVITLIYLPPTFTSTFFSMEMFKEVGVSVWATVCLPLLALTVTLVLIGYRASRIKQMKEQKKAMEAAEDFLPPYYRDSERLDNPIGRLRALLTFRRRNDDSDSDEGEWDLKKAQLGIVKWLLPGHWAVGRRELDLENCVER